MLRHELTLIFTDQLFFSCMCQGDDVIGMDQEFFFQVFIMTIDPPEPGPFLIPVDTVYFFISPESSHVKKKGKSKILFQMQSYFRRWITAAMDHVELMFFVEENR